MATYKTMKEIDSAGRALKLADPDTQIIEIKQTSESKYFHINWNITNKCNFSCTYCHPYNYEGSSPTFKLDTYKKFINKIKKQISKDRKLIISFAGGEPTAMPEFDELLTWLVEQDVAVGITTNGSKNIKFWEKHKKSFSWVAFSFHSEKTNITHCVKVVETLWAHTNLSVRVMMHPKEEYFNKCIDFFEILKTEPPESYFHVEKVPIIADWLTDKERPHNYTPKQQAQLEGSLWLRRQPTIDISKQPQFNDAVSANIIYQFKDKVYLDKLNTNQIYASQKNKFKGWSCNAGIDGLYVSELGFISGAACLPEGPDEWGTGIAWLGHIDKIDDFNLPTTPYICPKSACYCNTDIILGKKNLKVDLTDETIHTSVGW